MTLFQNDYPPDWPDIAKAVKEAAGWRCEHCGHPHDPAHGRTLTVHHLNGDKADCRPENLVALCQACHLHIQGTWQPGQSWLFDPPDWAVARGYASVKETVYSVAAERDA